MIWINPPSQAKLTYKAVTLLSGGVDSAAATASYITGHMIPRDEVLGLFFNYRQRSYRAERLAVQCVAEDLGIPCMEVPFDFRFLLPSVAGLGLLSGGDLSNPNITFVPGRNIIFLSQAASLAHVVGADTLVLGVLPGCDSYPDTTEGFVRAMEQAISRGLGSRMKIQNPLTALSVLEGSVSIKLASMKIARADGVRLHKTVSCYDAEVVRFADQDWIVPCGSCSSCLMRAACSEEVSYPLTDRDYIIDLFENHGGWDAS